LAKTKLPRIRFHDLRHAHATHLLANGVHPKVASERLGHSKVGITLDLYSHVLPGMVRGSRCAPTVEANCIGARHDDAWRRRDHWGAIRDPDGSDVPVMRTGALEPFRFRAERKQDRAEKIAIRFENGAFTYSFQRIRRHDHSRAAYFERDWAEFLTGAIYGSDSSSPPANRTPLQNNAAGSISRNPNSAC
jgi:hypothetical protein